MTKRIVSFLILIIVHSAIASPVSIEYFFQEGCNECAQVNALVLPILEERFSGKYELRKYDLNKEENFLLLMGHLENLQIDSNDPVCMIVGKRHYLGGFAAIDNQLCIIIEQELQNPVTNSETCMNYDRAKLQQRAEAFTIGTIVIAGVLDGFNPCVFSTLVFFMSLLSVSGIRRNRLLAVGSVYCFACFCTYIALGFGFFHALKLFSGYIFLQKGIELLLITILLLFAYLSFHDALLFHKTGRSQKIALQLPDRIKKWIRIIMRKGLNFRYLLPGTFLIGCSVTLLESACTGQVYVPTLVLMSREAGAGSRWFLLLLLYNVMFILPLLILFLAAWRGTTLSFFLHWSKANVVQSKIALGVFFLLLVSILIFWD